MADIYDAPLAYDDPDPWDGAAAPTPAAGGFAGGGGRPRPFDLRRRLAPRRPEARLLALVPRLVSLAGRSTAVVRPAVVPIRALAATAGRSVVRPGRAVVRIVARVATSGRATASRRQTVPVRVIARVGLAPARPLSADDREALALLGVGPAAGELALLGFGE